MSQMCSMYVGKIFVGLSSAREPRGRSYFLDSFVKLHLVIARWFLDAIIF